MFNVPRSIWDCYWRFQSGRRAKQIARDIVPELWGATRRKVGTSSGSAKDLQAYAEGRAAQLAQPLVDDFLRAHTSVPAIEGNRMIVLATADAAKRVLAMADAAETRHVREKRMLPAP